ncbi:MAG TPA: AMP-binding protein, partial [Rhabdochlamydiaceae bacterium]|nr:AMP-binding protein [Rhabdochlamydiaceae bacterium]
MRLCPLFEWSVRTPEKPALLIESETISYRQVNEKIGFYCGQIKALNLPMQSRLPFIATTSLETVCFFFAAWRLKMIACPLSFRLPEQAIFQTLKRLNAPLITPQPGPLEKSVEINENLLATMLLTSGSTGQPKIACHRLSQHLTSAETVIPLLHLESNDCYLASLPFFHVGGIALMLRTFL